MTPEKDNVLPQSLDARDQARVIKDRATAALAAGKLDAALADFREVVKLAPQDLLARKKIAELLVRMNRIPEAIAAYKHLVGRYITDGQYLQAIALCKVVLQLNPAHTSARQVLAKLHEKRSHRSHWMEQLSTSMARVLDFTHVRSAHGFWQAT